MLQIDEGSLSEMIAHGRAPISSIGSSQPPKAPTTFTHGKYFNPSLCVPKKSIDANSVKLTLQQ